MHVDGTFVYCRSSEGSCVRAAIANAVFVSNAGDRQEKSNAASRVLELGSVPEEGFRNASKWMETNVRRYALRNVEIPEGLDKHLSLMDQSEGLFLLTLQGVDAKGETNEHMVLADAGDGLLYDCEEPKAMRLCQRSLECCVGDRFFFVVICGLCCCPKPLFALNLGTKVVLLSLANATYNRMYAIPPMNPWNSSTSEKIGLLVHYCAVAVSYHTFRISLTRLF